MTPEALRRVADLLEQESPDVLEAIAWAVKARKGVALSSGALRQRRWRERLEGVSKGVSRASRRDASETVPPTTPSGREGEIPDLLSVDKSPEVQKNPEIQKELSGTAGVRARGARGVSRNASRDGVSRVTSPAWRRVPESWQPTDTHRELAASLSVDFELSLAGFRDHEFARPKRDADAAFRQWLRSPYQQTRSPGNRRVGGPETLLERAERMGRPGGVTVVRGVG